MKTATNTQQEHIEAVDLGLPSGTKWAPCNVGASQPEEYGDWYAWGETTIKEKYDKLTYSFSDKCENDFSAPSENICGRVNDVAHAIMGKRWRMPTIEQIVELVDCCSYEWTALNNIEGGRLTGPNGNSIFLPAAGYRYGTRMCYQGYLGFYWSGMMCLDFKDGAYGLIICEKEASYFNYSDSSLGHSVRPVASD